MTAKDMAPGPGNYSNPHGCKPRDKLSYSQTSFIM